MKQLSLFDQSEQQPQDIPALADKITGALNIRQLAELVAYLLPPLFEPLEDDDDGYYMSLGGYWLLPEHDVWAIWNIADEMEEQMQELLASLPD